MKIFLGEVIESKLNEFTGQNGEVIQTWRLAIQLTDEKGVTFTISSRDPLYVEAQQITTSQNIRVECSPVIKQDGKIKYHVDKLEVVS